MPLPPPPPGPTPPSGLRSQSTQSVDRNSLPVSSPPTRRPPPGGITCLGPVPPTPAGLIDEGMEPCLPERGRPRDLTIDLQAAVDPSDAAEPPTSSPSAFGLLNRAGAVRHDKTILQRAESRTRTPALTHGLGDAATKPGQMSDLVVGTGADGSELATTRSNPRSAGARPQVGLYRVGEPSSSSSWQQESRNSTPRAPGSARLPRLDTGTPPFSPCPAKISHPLDDSASVAPRALPTPPPKYSLRRAPGCATAPALRWISRLRPSTWVWPKARSSLPPPLLSDSGNLRRRKQVWPRMPSGSASLPNSSSASREFDGRGTPTPSEPWARRS